MTCSWRDIMYIVTETSLSSEFQRYLCTTHPPVHVSATAGSSLGWNASCDLRSPNSIPLCMAIHMYWELWLAHNFMRASTQIDEFGLRNMFTNCLQMFAIFVVRLLLPQTRAPTIEVCREHGLTDSYIAEWRKSNCLCLPNWCTRKLWPSHVISPTVFGCVSDELDDKLDKFYSAYRSFPLILLAIFPSSFPFSHHRYPALPPSPFHRYPPLLMCHFRCCCPHRHSYCIKAKQRFCSFINYYTLLF